MNKVTLAIMAAGLGSRFGGLKQIQDVDGRGHKLLDFSVYDAICVGFDRIAFIVNREIKDIVHPDLLDVIKQRNIEITLVYQDLTRLVPKSKVKIDRKKPWGTGHAVACLDQISDGPLAVINADDFYGRDAFEKIFDFLSSIDNAEGSYAMVGYKLENTLSPNGSVSRGICSEENGYLKRVKEYKNIVACEGEICAKEKELCLPLDPLAITSVNMWGFSSDIVEKCKQGFANFIETTPYDMLLTQEYYLPTAVSNLIDEGRATVKVLNTAATWYGITYREDLQTVSEKIKAFEIAGDYSW